MSEKVCSKGHKFNKTSDCPTCPICAKDEMELAYANGFPKIGSPAYSALKHEDIKLDDLPNYTEKELLGIHGVGPKAVAILREFLKTKGQSFS